MTTENLEKQKVLVSGSGYCGRQVAEALTLWLIVKLNFEAFILKKGEVNLNQIQSIGKNDIGIICLTAGSFFVYFEAEAGAKNNVFSLRFEKNSTTTLANSKPKVFDKESFKHLCMSGGVTPQDRLERDFERSWHGLHREINNILLNHPVHANQTYENVLDELSNIALFFQLLSHDTNKLNDAKRALTAHLLRLKDTFNVQDKNTCSDTWGRLKAPIQELCKMVGIYDVTNKVEWKPLSSVAT